MKALHPSITPASNARERILLTACRHFYQDGVRATGIDRIIADSGVTKVTFYRHFPSKNDLILTFLEDRHQRWVDWFSDALQRHGNTPAALVPVLKEWFYSSDFRGCAFINSVGELAGVLPETVEITRHHKEKVVDTIETLIPPSPARRLHAQALALAVDGAIIRAQFDSTPNAALSALACIEAALNQLK